MAELKALSPGSTIGILGGGQLGRMLALAAGDLGLNCHIYCPEENSPAFAVSKAHTCADYDDEQALRAFANAVDVVTYEFENVPGETASVLSALVPVYPNPKVLQIGQDRLDEKNFFLKQGFGCAPFAQVDTDEDLQSALEDIGTPSVLKTRRLGYDGKGQVMLTASGDSSTAMADVGNAPAILEGFIDLKCEISVIVARGADGQTAIFDIAENVHKNHILFTSTVPASVNESVQDEARAIGQKLASALDYVGVLSVELFVTQNDALLVNEIAPRVHNSGHWTQDACLVSQFQQHIRAVAGWPLDNPKRHSDVIMTNLLGDEIKTWRTLAQEPNAAFHDYGKLEARPGRKMGHVNHIFERKA
ncbi:MAG: 5-(carboxyamino)imidazole ribonucleotide synthase [Hyphomicrobiales bacterium]